MLSYFPVDQKACYPQTRGPHLINLAGSSIFEAPPPRLRSLVLSQEGSEWRLPGARHHASRGQSCFSQHLIHHALRTCLVADECSRCLACLTRDHGPHGKARSRLAPECNRTLNMACGVSNSRRITSFSVALIKFTARLEERIDDLNMARAARQHQCSATLVIYTVEVAIAVTTAVHRLNGVGRGCNIAHHSSLHERREEKSTAALALGHGRLNARCRLGLTSAHRPRVPSHFCCENRALENIRGASSNRFCTCVVSTDYHPRTMVPGTWLVCSAHVQ